MDAWPQSCTRPCGIRLVFSTIDDSYVSFRTISLIWGIQGWLLGWYFYSCGLSETRSSLSLLCGRPTSREVNEASRPHTCSRPCAFEEKKHIPPHPKHTRPKMHFFFLETPYGHAQGCTKRRCVQHAECATHRVATHLPAGIEGDRTHSSTSLLRVCRSALFREQWLLVVDDVSKLEKILKLDA